MDLSSRISEFVNMGCRKINVYPYGYNGFTYGSGNGFGNSNYGYGRTNCRGNGCGYDYGNGTGTGEGYGNGYGYGNGDVTGYITGYGGGNGYGGSKGINTINGYNVYIIDVIPTIFTNVRGNVAKGFILEHNVNLKPTYVVKGNGFFAHGKTLREAQSALECKIIQKMDVEEKIKLFIKKFNDVNKQYNVKDFYDWHHKLTGSCEMGRQSFARNHGIDIDKDKLTVNEFIELTENSYCGQIIQQLKKAVKEHEHND